MAVRLWLRRGIVRRSICPSQSSRYTSPASTRAIRSSTVAIRRAASDIDKRIAQARRRFTPEEPLQTSLKVARVRACRSRAGFECREPRRRFAGGRCAIVLGHAAVGIGALEAVKPQNTQHRLFASHVCRTRSFLNAASIGARIGAPRQTRVAFFGDLGVQRRWRIAAGARAAKEARSNDLPGSDSGMHPRNIARVRGPTQSLQEPLDPRCLAGSFRFGASFANAT